MSVLLDDRPRIRQLRRACRRTGEVRRPPWWVLRRRTPQEDASNQHAVNAVFRFGLCVLIAGGGALVSKNPLAAQVLTLAAVVLVQARIERYRQLLASDPGLLLLASLPVDDRDILDYQLRRRWWPQVCNLLEGAGFWAVAWNITGAISWVWLPLVAVTHALLIEAVALLLLPRWRHSGCLLYLIVVGCLWAISAQDKYPVVRELLDPLLTLLAWMTPWGWLNQLALHLPKQPYHGASMVMLALVALVVIHRSRQRLESTWRLDPLLREFVGRPTQTWEQADDDGEPGAHRDMPGAATDRSDMSAAIEPACGPALVAARQHQAGGSLLTYGWPGRIVHARCDVFDRHLSDLLIPAGAGPVEWRWALLCAGAPAACALAGIALPWSLTVIAVVVLWRRMFYRAALLGLICTVGLLLPDFASAAGAGLPCVIAALLGMPWAGGAWHGLPMGSGVLGSVPRSWWRLMRIMLMLTGMRLVAGFPIMALILITLGVGVDLIPCAVTALAFLVMVLAVPWIVALRLVQRTPNGIDISLGRPGLTMLNVVCILLHCGAAVAMLIGGVLTPVASDDLAFGSLVLFITGLTVSLVTTGLHVALLRHAYRRTVDLL